MVKQSPRGEGYEANGQNKDRSENPYITPAMSWDIGWLARENAERRHRLEDPLEETFQELIDKVTL